MLRHKGLPHDEIAHRWANDPAGEDYAEGFDMYFSERTIYSYWRHSPIARHVENPRGEKAVLFTTESYGVGTSKHCKIVRRAINHIKKFDVPSLSGGRGYEVDHAANMRSYQAVYDGVIDRAERVNANSYAGINHFFQTAKNTIKESADYAAFFDIDDCVVPAFKIHLDWLQARWYRLTSPEATAERERKAERRRELEARHHQKTIEAYCRGEIHLFRDSRSAHLMTGEQVNRREAFERVFYSSRIAEWAAGEQLPRYTPSGFGALNDTPELIASHAQRLANPEQIAERYAFDLEAHKEAIANWRAGANIHFRIKGDVPVILRVREKSVQGTEVYAGEVRDWVKEIETSWGARFPAEEAHVALRYIQAVRRKGETWYSNGDQAPKLGYYKIDKITGAGDVRAGCHLVPWSEIERLAIELGWIESNGS